MKPCPHCGCTEYLCGHKGPNECSAKINNNIIIQDWAGNILYQGDYRRKKVDKVLDINRCTICKEEINEKCPECSGTGYKGDFEVMWEDQDHAPYENVYECINY